jgi:phosphoglycolate phosphatase-like HAD superfamily hydrolase
MFVVFDIDGTLADCSHRLQYAQSKEWDEFHKRCMEDLVIVNIADLMIQLAETADVLLLTGRPEKYRFMTNRWLSESQLSPYYDELLMRPDDDFTPDYQMKINALEKYFGDKQTVLDNVWLVIDDRDSVVEGLRNYGLTVLQAAAGGY